MSADRADQQKRGAPGDQADAEKAAECALAEFYRTDSDAIWRQQ